MNDETPLTITVEEAGRKYFGIGRDASYRAAQRGDIPTIRVGRLLRVPVAAMERRLESADDWQKLGDIAQRIVDRRRERGSGDDNIPRNRIRQSLHG